MIDTKAIRSKILDLAIQGKLTEQFPEDGTAEELYKQIQAEKQTLIKSGKPKKEKPLPEIAEDEIPFEIPDNWKWVVFSSIITLQSGQDLKPEEYNANGKGIPYLTGASNFDEKGSLFINRWTEKPKNIAVKNDILLSCKGTVGKLAILEADRVHIARQFMSIRTYKLDVNFACYFLQSVIQRIKEASKGLIPGIERNDILQLLVPLPPLAEQKRIVEKIEQAFSVLDIIDELQAKYAGNLTVLKSKLIDLAIQGKLTEQLPEDGTADELYQQIQAEKQALIKSGKIKKEKPLPEIAEDEIPFEIPDNWKWVRLGEFGSWHAGATPSRGNSEYYNGSIPWLKTGDLNDGYITSVPEHITELALKECSVQLNPVGSVLIAMYGATIGKLGIAGIPLTTNQACCVCIPYNGIYNRFLFSLLMSMRKEFIGMGIGGAQSNISREKIVNAVVPLPPLAEQKRIVERLDQILAVCDEMR